MESSRRDPTKRFCGDRWHIDGPSGGLHAYIHEVRPLEAVTEAVIAKRRYARPAAPSLRGLRGLRGRQRGCSWRTRASDDEALPPSEVEQSAPAPAPAARQRLQSRMEAAGTETPLFHPVVPRNTREGFLEITARGVNQTTTPAAVSASSNT